MKKEFTFSYRLTGKCYCKCADSFHYNRPQTAVLWLVLTALLSLFGLWLYEGKAAGRTVVFIGCLLYVAVLSLGYCLMLILQYGQYKRKYLNGADSVELHFNEDGITVGLGEKTVAYSYGDLYNVMASPAGYLFCFSDRRVYLPSSAIGYDDGIDFRLLVMKFYRASPKKHRIVLRTVSILVLLLSYFTVFTYILPDMEEVIEATMPNGAKELYRYEVEEGTVLIFYDSDMFMEEGWDISDHNPRLGWYFYPEKDPENYKGEVSDLRAWGLSNSSNYDEPAFMDRLDGSVYFTVFSAESRYVEQYAAQGFTLITFTYEVDHIEYTVCIREPKEVEK